MTRANILEERANWGKPNVGVGGAPYAVLTGCARWREERVRAWEGPIARDRRFCVSHDNVGRMPYNGPMATLEDIARFLGISKRAVRIRVNALGEMLEDYMTRGARNRLIFRGEAVAILRRLEELRQREGLPIQQAAERLKGELSDETPPSGIYLVVQADVETAVLKDVLHELCQERDRWREYALALQSVLPEGLKWLNQISPAVPGDSRLN